jgi:2-iminobutanoate/2-iminopropanoate deaminase
MKKQFITPENVPEAKTYSHAVRAGNTVYLAGNVGRRADGTLVSSDLAAQAQQAFENMQRTLDAAGACLSDVVKLTIHLVDIRGMSVVAEVRSRFFQAPMPASTAVQVSALAPGVLLEIDGIAVIDDE